MSKTPLTTLRRITRPVLAGLVIFCLPLAAADYVVNQLMPQPGQLILPHKLMAAFSYENLLGDAVNPKRVKLFFDGQELTAGVTVTSRYLAFVPDGLFKNRPDLPGHHTFHLRFYDGQNRIVQEEEYGITIVEPVVFRNEEKRSLPAGDLRQQGRLTITDTYDDYAYGDRNVTDGRLTYTMRKEKWFVNTDVYFTSDESGTAQPRHTARVDLAYGRGVRLGLGDRYPNYHPYILSGQRVRGVELNLKTYNRGINTLNLDVVYGLSRMGSANLGYTADGIEEIGMYKRRLLAINPKFGSGQKFQLGVILLKAKDDPGSISSDALLIGDTPKDNLVIGANIIARTWKQRVTFFGNWALGLYTDDISTGTISEKQIEDMMGSDAGLAKILKKYENYLVVNTSTSFMDPSFLSLPQSMAYDCGMQLNLPCGSSTASYTTFKYKMIGPAFLSLGRENMESSKIGFDVSQHFLLFNRKLNLAGNFGTYRNNLDELMPEDTEFTNYSVSASFRPAPFLPSLNLSWASNTSINGDTSHIYARDNASDNMHVATQYRLGTGPINNTLSLFYSQAAFSNLTADKMTNDNTGIGIVSQFDNLPLRTNLRFVTNRNSADSDMRSSQIDAGGTFTLAARKLEANIIVTSLMYDNNDTANRLTSGLGITFRITPQMDLDLTGKYFRTGTGAAGYARAEYIYRFFE